MSTHHDRQWRRMKGATTVLAAAALGLSACGTGPELPGSYAEQSQDQPAEPFAGPYDQVFAADLDAYAVDEISLTGEVETIVSPVAFTITAAGDTDVDPLLVVNFDEDASRLAVGQQVEVTGTVHEAYNVPDTEENLGDPPGPEVLAFYDGQPFFNATSVEIAEPQDTASPS
ncbi:hypothetical protein GMA12_17535 [Kocuria sediminis]|uniref:Uncharacterized protein n=1 Tax=Kocuria sediminis TaxID=1038857 RepID=A0A6N8GRL8_9MICC|nr:hypothetical protein [Kocuria sediminis]MUN64920.1 hypothetical protein [Kocuria sediminis]